MMSYLCTVASTCVCARVHYLYIVCHLRAVCQQRCSLIYCTIRTVRMRRCVSSHLYITLAARGMLDHADLWMDLFTYLVGVADQSHLASLCGLKA